MIVHSPAGCFIHCSAWRSCTRSAISRFSPAVGCCCVVQRLRRFRLRERLAIESEGRGLRTQPLTVGRSEPSCFAIAAMERPLWCNRRASSFRFRYFLLRHAEEQKRALVLNASGESSKGTPQSRQPLYSLFPLIACANSSHIALSPQGPRPECRPRQPAGRRLVSTEPLVPV